MAFNNPVVGMRIVDIRGREVGTVEAVANGAFAVAMPGHSFWLADECIFHVEDGVVTLQLNREQVERCKIDPPAVFPSGAD